MSANSETPGARALLLERDAELERAGAAIDLACAGSGRVLIVEGPAGIGKTELLRAVRELASERGMQSLPARGDDLEHDFPYGIARQLFEPVVRQTPGAALDSLLEGAAAPAAAILGSGGSADSSFSALHALFWLTSNLAECRPLLLAVDDAHWADLPSLRFLHYLARRLGELPVLLVIARRPAEPGANHELIGRIAAEVGARVLALAPLREAAAAGLVRDLLGGDAEQEFCRACHTATCGNPFLLHELAHALREEGVAPTRAEAPRVGRIAPEGISRRVLVRLLRLPPDARALAHFAAVLGTGVALRTAAALTGLEDAAAARAADGLVAADVLAGVQPLEFVHPIVREVIYADIPPAERAFAHARAALVLSEAGAPAEETAVQLLAAEPAGQQWAVDALCGAAREALRRGEPGSAAIFLERALAEPPTPERGPQLSRELGRAKTLAGDPCGSEHLRAALDATPAGAQRARVASELAHAYIAVGRFGDAVDLLENAIGELGWYDRELALRLEAEMSTTGRQHPATYVRTAKRLELVARNISGETPAERLLVVSLATQRAMELKRPATEVAALVERSWTGGLLAEQT
jgi:predicted ATPase